MIVQNQCLDAREVAIKREGHRRRQINPNGVTRHMVATSNGIGRGQRVGAVEDEQIVPIITRQIVIACAAAKNIVSSSSRNDIVSSPAINRVIAITAQDAVIARTTTQGVVTFGAVDGVIHGPAGHRVAKIATSHREGPVGLVCAVPIQGRRGESGCINHEVFACGNEPVYCHDSCVGVAKLYRFDLRHIVEIAGRKPIIGEGQHVVVATANDRIVPVKVACHNDQVVASASVDAVCARSAHYCIITSAGRDHVASAKADNAIIAAASVDCDVHICVSSDDVIARAQVCAHAVNANVPNRDVFIQSVAVQCPAIGIHGDCVDAIRRGRNDIDRRLGAINALQLIGIHGHCRSNNLDHIASTSG